MPHAWQAAAISSLARTTSGCWNWPVEVLADCGAIDAFEEELEDRFGGLPDDAKVLLAVASLRCTARGAGIARIVAGPAAIAFEPHRRRTIAPGDLPLEEKDGRWLLRERIDDPIARLERVGDVVDTIAADAGR